MRYGRRFRFGKKARATLPHTKSTFSFLRGSLDNRVQNIAPLDQGSKRRAPTQRRKGLTGLGRFFRRRFGR